MSVTMLQFRLSLSDPTHEFLTSKFTHLSIAKPPPSTVIRMGGGPRTYPGGVSKWQWKRMQAKKAKQLLRARLSRERQIYEMRKRAELTAAVSELERPWEVVEKAPRLFSTTADEQLKVLADRFQKPGGFDLWSEKDGPQLFETSDGIPSARFFPKGVVHSIKPYGRITDGQSYQEEENACEIEKNDLGVGYEFLNQDSGSFQGNEYGTSYIKKDGKRRIHGRKQESGLDSKVFLNQDSGSFQENEYETRSMKKDGRRKIHGRKQESGLESKVFDMDLQDDGSFGISDRRAERK